MPLGGNAQRTGLFITVPAVHSHSSKSAAGFSIHKQP